MTDAAVGTKKNLEKYLLALSFLPNMPKSGIRRKSLRRRMQGLLSMLRNTPSEAHPDARNKGDEGFLSTAPLFLERLLDQLFFAQGIRAVLQGDRGMQDGGSS